MASVFRIIKFIVAVGVLFLASACEDPDREKNDVSLISKPDCRVADPVYIKTGGIIFQFPHSRFDFNGSALGKYKKKESRYYDVPLLSTKNKEVREGYCAGYTADTAMESDRSYFNQSVEEFGHEPGRYHQSDLEIAILQHNNVKNYVPYCMGKFYKVGFNPSDHAEEYIPIYSNQILSKIQPYPGVYSYEWNKNTKNTRAGAGDFWNESNKSHHVAKDALFFNQPFFFKCINRDNSKHFSYSLCFVEQQLNSQSEIRMEFARDLLENKGGENLALHLEGIVKQYITNPEALDNLPHAVRKTEHGLACLNPAQ